jgi:hypothetical protein
MERKTWMSDKKVSRRDFLRKTGLGTTGAAATLTAAQQAIALPQETESDRALVVAAMGNTLIPSAPGDPGYKTLEPYNITAEVLKGLDVEDEDLAQFNSQAGEWFSGKSFTQLSESEQANYFDLVLSGERFADKERGEKLKRVLMGVRRQVFQVFYRNYPEHTLARDANGTPIQPAGDEHQITNPNTRTLNTGWDVAGYMGPLNWEEEERRRARAKKIDWHE